MKKIRKFDERILREEGSQKNIYPPPPLLPPLRGTGQPNFLHVGSDP